MATSQRRPPLTPMLASIGKEIPGVGWAYEPKYDGIRVLAAATLASVQLVTRNQIDKATQFPEIEHALQIMALRLDRSIILDGEIVAVNGNTPMRFQQLQARMHIRAPEDIAVAQIETSVAFIAFDLLLDGSENLLQQSWSQRRSRLEHLLNSRLPKEVHQRVWVSDVLASPRKAPGKELLDLAKDKGWEGIIAKRMDSPYQPGIRTPAWQKLKVEFRQEFVVGGYTDPRRTRLYFGALLLGYYDEGALKYAGHVGGGFNQALLKMLHQRLRPLEQKSSPFETPPRTNERAHWVYPQLVAEVKFSQWTDDGRLRHPIFLGLREDINSQSVGREARSVQGETPMPPDSLSKPFRAKRSQASAPQPSTLPVVKQLSALLAQIDEIERQGEGILTIGRGKLEITHAGKIVFPKDRFTKSDLLRYYTRISPLILPAIKKRPLVLRRFPNGIDSGAFYQHQAKDVPAGVRTAKVHIGGGDREQIIGGDLLTLLYTIQMGSISVDPWHAHVPTIQYADYTILDLDPGSRTSFKTVIAVARWVKEVLDELGLHGVLKTSGATGMHVYLPLPKRTTNETAQVLAELIATTVATQHPKEATVERAVRKRKTTTVYVDYLQNILGKTVVGPYSVRARPGAPVSTPLNWDELIDSLHPMNFTMTTVLDRFAAVGDIWGEAMRTPNSLKDIVRASG